MWSLPWADVLVGGQGRSWRTVPQERSVLVVVHTVTAATRLFDVLGLWSGDHRVQTAFTCTRTSAFTTGTEELLRERGIEPIPWEQAVEREFDLAVAASYGGPLHALRAPLIVLPHGMGYNKFAPGARHRESARNPVFGLSESTLVHDGRLVPSVAVLSHAEQRERLREYCPEALDVALIAGDPCFDRMLASRPLRETYRQRFAADPDRRVVVVSSTWGGESLLARCPTLVARLARRLPLDEYRIVVALHPNIWSAHTPWQVRGWTEEWTRAGATVLPPHEGWRAALVAADVTIGDHGSVTFYSAALGVPVLLASAPVEAVDAVSPIARFLRAAPRLDPDGDLPTQIESAITAHQPDRYDSIVEHTTSVPGESARLLRSTVYERLKLDEPFFEAETIAVPVPPAAPTEPSSQVVHLKVDEHQAVATRLPAESLREAARLPADAVLVATTSEPTRRWLEWAEILLHDDRCADPQQWIRATLARLPAATLAVTRDEAGRWVVGGRDTPLVRFTGPDDLGPVFAAFVHHRIAAEARVLPSTVSFRLGRRVVSAGVEVG
ncbi:hypothetical protein OOZ19_06060 [Saccharopolyspora sp. NFXS83]|uniref:hypothetical protein n=1 Tax=Saccharopolyspora sp. NFXS83 TaxID=2993560 RepID=UPI00224A5D5F|nr:hypothetical protein [Saccharopolyspora sp. NFXS83]MCX2729795.1 hypothetical protein [Saccharopolyspora sp. NFXS83]